MNKKMIGKLVGVLFFLEALFMLPAIAVCFVYGETGAPLRLSLIHILQDC